MRLNAFLVFRRIVLTVTLLLLTTPAWGADTPVERNTLKGITEVTVDVSPIKSEAERDGLRRSQVQTDVELRLRHSGIKVVPPSNLAVPCVFVRIHTLTLKEHRAYVYSIQLELYQGVSLQRDPLILSHTATWSHSIVGLVGAERVFTVRSDVDNLVDTFINAYLEQNPKR